MNTEARVIKNLFEMLKKAQIVALEAKDSKTQEKARKRLNRITVALQKKLIKEA